MTAPVERTPRALFIHDLRWSDHEKPRWMRATCLRCRHVWAVHQSETGWRPPQGCHIAPTSPEGATKR